MRPSCEEQVMEIKRLAKEANMRLGKRVYLVSSDWIRQWKKSVGFAASSIPIGDCPPIDNQALAEEKERNPDQKPTISHGTVSRVVWETWHKWYGGGPIVAIPPLCEEEEYERAVNVLWGKVSRSVEFEETEKASTIKATACNFFGVKSTDYGLYMTKGPRKPLDVTKTLPELGVEAGSTLILDILTHRRNVTWDVTLMRSSLLQGKMNVPARTVAPQSPGLVGLKNSGNTCFINAGLQCLLHTEPLIEFFRKGAWKRELNVGSTGMKGDAATEFDKLISMASGSVSKGVEATGLISVLRRSGRLQHGSVQQDAHEYLMSILDLIHEDLNKGSPEPCESVTYEDGMEQEELARLSWEAHKKRNDSVIVDLFHGLMRSHLKCPRCNKYTYIFEPCVSISLPLSMPRELTPKFTFIPYDPTLPNTIMSVPKRTGFHGSTLKDLLREAVGRNFDCIFAQKNKKDEYDFLTGSVGMKGDGELFVFEIPLIQDQGLYVMVKLALPVRGRFKKKTKVVETDYVLKIPGESVDAARLQRLLDEKFGYLWEASEPSEVPESLVVLKGNMKPRKTSERISLKKVENMKFPRDKRKPYLTARTITAVINPKFCRDEDHFDWSRVKRRVVERESPTVTSEIPTIEDCFEQFSHASPLDERNKWLCPSCQDYVMAEKKIDVWDMPQCVIIHLKRFCVTSRGVKKIERNISIPDEIDMSTFITGPKGRERQQYKLYGVVKHFGQMNSGHYVANAYTSNRWMAFDDSKVREIADSHVSNGYVLFYAKSE